MHMCMCMCMCMCVCMCVCMCMCTACALHAHCVFGLPQGADRGSLYLGHDLIQTWNSWLSSLQMLPSAPAPLTCGRAMPRRAGSSARVRARRSYSTLYGVQQLLPPRVVCAPRVEPGIFTLSREGAPMMYLNSYLISLHSHPRATATGRAMPSPCHVPREHFVLRCPSPTLAPTLQTTELRTTHW